MQQSLVEILLLEDLENKKKACLSELRNLEIYKKQIRDFFPILNNAFSIPITVSKYRGKIMYVDFILLYSRVYLSLNCVYSKQGEIKSVESVTKRMAIRKLTDVNDIRTLSGKKFKLQIDVNNYNIVTVVNTSALTPKDDNVRIIENGLEVFAAREKIVERFSRYFDVQS